MNTQQGWPDPRTPQQQPGPANPMGQAPEGSAKSVFAPLEPDDPRSIAGYQIRAKLGSGGMGKVYLSYTPGGRPVAIKVIRPDFAQDPEFRRRFQQEVTSAQRVQGLYTAPVIDCDTQGAIPWLATAYVPGPSLHAAVAEHGALPVATVVLLVAGIAEALQVIHKAGIIHRDLKPANVLLASDGPRVIDFGIARAADATSLTASGVTVGSPAFMAPEQAEGTACTPATDLFALGQVAAYAAMGGPAFGEGTSASVLYRIVHEQPDLSQLPAELTELVTRCLAKAPEDRPTVAEVLNLCAQASGQTSLRRPEDWVPSSVAADITRLTNAAAAPAAGPAATHPPTTLDAPMATPRQTSLPPRQAPPMHQPAAMPQQPGGFGPQHPFSGYPTTTGGPPPQPGGPMPFQQPGFPGPAPVGIGPAPRPQPRRKRVGLMVVGAVVGLVLIGAVASALSKGDDTKDSGPRANSPQASSSHTAGTNNSSAGQSKNDDSYTTPDDQPSANAAPPPKQYPGINLVEMWDLELNIDPPQPVERDTSGADLDYKYGGGMAPLGNNKLVLLDRGQTGDYKTCNTDTRYASLIEGDKMPQGAQICVTNDQGPVALLKVAGYSSPSDASHYVTLDVTVWR